MTTDPTILAVYDIISLVKQNIEFTWKKTGFYFVWSLSSRCEHKLKIKQITAQQSLDDHAANGCLEPTLTGAAASLMPASQKIVCWLSILDW